jgi:hypothetical protein
MEQQRFVPLNRKPLSARGEYRTNSPASAIEENGVLFGATVILASCIAAKADGGEILVGTRCAASAPARAACSPTGVGFVAKGLGRAVAGV